MNGIKKVISIFTLISLVFFITACATSIIIIEKKPLEIKKSEQTQVKIRAVQTIYGEMIEFQKKIPGKIVEGNVTGFTIETKLLEIPKDQIKRIVRHEEKIKIFTKDGKSIECIAVVRDKNENFFYLSSREKANKMTIPLVDVEILWIDDEIADGLPVVLIPLLLLSVLKIVL